MEKRERIKKEDSYFYIIVKYLNISYNNNKKQKKLTNKNNKKKCNPTINIKLNNFDIIYKFFFQVVKVNYSFLLH